MSMRGDIISKEYQKMVWVQDERGGEYVCYANDIKNQNQITEAEKKNCLDTSLVMGPNW